jgi:HAE1 family hydrophobic/amphiphilic exporter-1
MTAFSGLVGFFPLAIATGAGAASRQSLGTALFGGYLVSTFLSLFMVPLLYIIIKSLNDRFLPPNKDHKDHKDLERRIETPQQTL